MRDILIEQSRRKKTRKHGGGKRRIELAAGLAIIEPPADDLLAVDEAIQKLRVEMPDASLTRLRHNSAAGSGGTCGPGSTTACQ